MYTYGEIAIVLSGNLEIHFVFVVDFLFVWFFFPVGGKAIREFIELFSYFLIYACKGDFFQICFCWEYTKCSVFNSLLI